MGVIGRLAIPDDREAVCWCRDQYAGRADPHVRTRIKVDADGTVRLYADGAAIPMTVKPGEEAVVDTGMSSYPGQRDQGLVTYAVYLVKERVEATAMRLTLPGPVGDYA